VRRPVRRAGDAYRVRLLKGEREVLRELARQLGDLLRNEDPSHDPSLVRLYPPAHPDDPIAELEYERVAHDDLLAGRIRAIETLARTADAASLSEEELLAWLGTLNDMRLVLGTRLDITEETTAQAFPRGDPRRDTYQTYAYLTWLVDAIVRELN
jgi:hypothetical protein